MVDFGSVAVIAQFRGAFCWPCWAHDPERVEVARRLVDAFCTFAGTYSRWAEIFRGESGVAFLVFDSGGPDPENLRGLVMVPFASACSVLYQGPSVGDGLFPDWGVEDPELFTFDWTNKIPPVHCVYPLEAEALKALAREASASIPTLDAALDRVDWNRKRELHREEQRQRAQTLRDREEQRERERVACEAQHVRTLQLLEAAGEEGLHCPKCGKRSHAFRISKHRDTSLICPSCARSFYLVEPPPKG